MAPERKAKRFFTPEQKFQILQSVEADIKGGMKVKVQSILRALRLGVSDVHIIDGRTPHSLIAELFTDSGIGTLVKPSRPSVQDGLPLRSSGPAATSGAVS